MNFARADRSWMIVSRGQLDDRELNTARRNDGYRRLGYLTPVPSSTWNRAWDT